MLAQTVIFTGKNQCEVVAEDVGPLAPDQVLVQARLSLVSTGTEGICYARNFAPGTHWDTWVKYPFHPGYNWVGEVVETGPEAAGWAVGQRVATRFRHQGFGCFTVGAGAQSRGADSRLLHRVPDGVPDDEAVWLGMAHIVQVGVRAAEHQLGDTVVVVGLGILGQLVTQYARLSGASQIIVIDPARPRQEMARAHGATTVLDMGVQDAREAVFDLTGGRGADVVYDVTGHPVVFQHALGLVRRLGKLVLLGDAGTPSEQRLTGDVVTRGVRIIGAHDSHAPDEETERNSWTQRQQIELFFNYMERGLMRLGDLITHRYAPADAPEAYRMLATDRDRALGVVFEWKQQSAAG